jgi:hypothetical protein
MVELLGVFCFPYWYLASSGIWFCSLVILCWLVCCSDLFDWVILFTCEWILERGWFLLPHLWPLNCFWSVTERLALYWFVWIDCPFTGWFLVLVFSLLFTGLPDPWHSTAPVLVPLWPVGLFNRFCWFTWICLCYSGLVSVVSALWVTLLYTVDQMVFLVKIFVPSRVLCWF